MFDLQEIRWVCLLPDPVTGLDAPVCDSNGQPRIWMAPNREIAVRLVRNDLAPNAFSLSSVISFIDWDARKLVQQRRKLTQEPLSHSGAKNPRCRCLRCHRPTFSSDSALYCKRCRRSGYPAKRRSA